MSEPLPFSGVSSNHPQSLLALTHFSLDQERGVVLDRRKREGLPMQCTKPLFRSFILEDHSIGGAHGAFLIAEAGVNHNGDWDLTRRLVDAAVTAGADAVKFQTFRADWLASPTAPKARYQFAGTDPAESQHAMLLRLEISAER